MKKTLILGITMLMGFLCEIHAQSAVSQLRKYCTIEKDAEYILEYSTTSQPLKLRMSELRSDHDKDDIQLYLFIDQEWERSSVPLNLVASALWTLISKQPNGQAGTLTLKMLNFIPIKGSSGVELIACTMWDPSNKKWLIFSLPVASVKIIRGGSRKFRL